MRQIEPKSKARKHSEPNSKSKARKQSEPKSKSKARKVASKKCQVWIGIKEEKELKPPKGTFAAQLPLLHAISASPAHGPTLIQHCLHQLGVACACILISYSTRQIDIQMHGTHTAPCPSSASPPQKHDPQEFTICDI